MPARGTLYKIHPSARADASVYSFIIEHQICVLDGSIVLSQDSQPMFSNSILIYLLVLSTPTSTRFLPLASKVGSNPGSACLVSSSHPCLCNDQYAVEIKVRRTLQLRPPLLLP